MSHEPADGRHESRLLLAILREGWDEAESLVRARVPDPWTFVSVVRGADVHPQVHSILERSDRFDLVGDDARRRLFELRRKCGIDNLLLLALAERALDVLLGAGIVPVALKGLDVLHRLGVRFDERTLDDIDLLVEPGTVGAAIRALEDAGWKTPAEPERTHWIRSSHHIMLRSPGAVPVELELHWNLVQERRYRLDPADLFRRALPLDVAGRTVLRLEDHDQVANLLLHHLAHFFDRRLKWGLDLERLVAAPGYEWRIVAERLSDWGGSTAAGMALRHLLKVFPDTIPEEALRLLPVSGWRRALSLPLRSSHPLELFRATRRRPVQLLLAAVLLERPSELPGWLLHRATRDRSGDEGPLEKERAAPPPRRDGTHRSV
jgi:hypothetical protein